MIDTNSKGEFIDVDVIHLIESEAEKLLQVCRECIEHADNRY